MTVIENPASRPLTSHRRAAADLPPPAERRAIRDAARFTRREVAERLGVSESSIRLWESPKSPTPIRAHLAPYMQLLREMQAYIEAAKQTAEQPDVTQT